MELTSIHTLALTEEDQPLWLTYKLLATWRGWTRIPTPAPPPGPKGSFPAGRRGRPFSAAWPFAR